MTSLSLLYNIMHSIQTCPVSLIVWETPAIYCNHTHTHQVWNLTHLHQLEMLCKMSDSSKPEAVMYPLAIQLPLNDYPHRVTSPHHTREPSQAYTTHALALTLVGNESPSHGIDRSGYIYMYTHTHTHTACTCHCVDRAAWCHVTHAAVPVLYLSLYVELSPGLSQQSHHIHFAFLSGHVKCCETSLCTETHSQLTQCSYI